MEGLVLFLVSRHAGDNSDYLVRLDQFFSVPSCVPCLLTDFFEVGIRYLLEISILEDVYSDKWQYSPGDSIPQPQLNLLTC